MAGGTDSAGSADGHVCYPARRVRFGLVERTFGGSGNEIAFGVSEAADGDSFFVVTANPSQAAGATLTWSERMRPVVWQQTYGATPFQRERHQNRRWCVSRCGEQRATHDAVSCVYVVCIEEDGVSRSAPCEDDPEVKTPGRRCLPECGGPVCSALRSAAARSGSRISTRGSHGV